MSASIREVVSTRSEASANDAANDALGAGLDECPASAGENDERGVRKASLSGVLGGSGRKGVSVSRSARSFESEGGTWSAEQVAGSAGPSGGVSTWTSGVIGGKSEKTISGTGVDALSERKA